MTSTVPHRVTLCVLPFENLSEQGVADYFSRGFLGDLVTEFSRFSELAVVSGQHEPRSAALAANYALRGTLRRDGTRVRVSTELLDCATGAVIWAERLERDGTGTFAIQDEICAQVVSLVSTRIRSNLTAAARRKETANFLAYDYWLRGVDELRRGSLSADERARQLFDAALQHDPTYARAHVGLSLSHFNEWSCQLWQRWDENEQQAYAHAQRALGLDEADHWCQLVLGRILLFRREFERAEQHLTRSLLLNGNDADALIQLAMSMAFLDRRELALTLFERALARNPLHDTTYYAYGLAGAFANERYIEVVSYADRLPPDVMVDMRAYAAAAHQRLGNHEAARRALDDYVREFDEKIARGRAVSSGEALRWLQHVNPYRSREVETRLLSSLRAIGSSSRAKQPAIAEAPDLCVFRRVGSLWQATYENRSAWLPSCKGFADLQVLMATPGREVHCAELMGNVGSTSDPEVIDVVAREQYRARVLELENQLEDADTSRAIAIQGELDAVRAQLNAAFGLGGKTRKMAAPGDRARSAVTQRLKAAVKRVAESHPALGEHFQACVRTGTFCSYVPTMSLEWQL